jgi:endonuclease YncB( thermonuclease family)
MIVGSEERARRNRALSCLRRSIAGGFCLSLSMSPAFAAQQCAADRIDEHVQVAYAHDGDTVRLQDGRSVRLIGIDTPELGRDGAPDQPIAAAARDALRALLARRPELNLRFDITRHDSHGRLLAHAFLSDGTSVSAWLLERGYATLLIMPPNEWNSRCYQSAERRAHTSRLGIWGLPAYQPVPSTHLDRAAQGYRLIKGRVVHVGKSAHSLWLDLEGKVAARIDREDLNYFAAVPLSELLHKEVIVRGWVHPHQDEMQLRLRYPADLEIVER